MQKEGKSAAVAVILSILWPGIGHFYLGSSGKGTQFLLMALGGWGLTSTLFGAIIGIPLLLVTYIWAPIDANQVAKA